LPRPPATSPRSLHDALPIFVGMTGMGGGSLMTPILILLFGFDAKVAVGTDILHGAVFKSFGAVRHRMLGTVHGHLALWMLAGSGDRKSTRLNSSHVAISYAV